MLPQSLPSGIVCTHLGFAWADGSPVFVGLDLALGPGRTGLVGPNGAGKSTFLRLLVGHLRPTAGTLSVHGVVGYLPQTLLLAAERTMAEVLGVTDKLAALRAIEAGDARDDLFALLGDDWDIAERVAAVLGRLGLANIALERTVATLSGGQAMGVGLAAQLLREPDVLILDEPSNNLDLDARDRLYDLVAGWRGPLLIASHDRDLLDRVDQIAELSPAGIRLYGGNFAAYVGAVAAEQAATARAVRTAELDLRRQRREAQEARERSARRASTGKRHAKTSGLPAIVAGAMQRRAEVSAGRSAGLHERREDGARERLAEAARGLRDEERLRLALPATRVPTGRTLFEAAGVTLAYPGGAPILGPPGLDLAIRGPERIALVGPNGAGKTTLLRLLAGEIEPTSGHLRRYDPRTTRTLPQRLDLLAEEGSVLANLRRFAPGLPNTELRNRLAGFLFGGERVHLPIRDLSGGERLRATLACLLAAEPAPQLLLLDEPTNNLDLRGVAHLEQALAAYEGALVVASHDLPFLSQIGIGRWLRVVPGEGLLEGEVWEPLAVGISAAEELPAIAVPPVASPAVNSASER